MAGPRYSIIPADFVRDQRADIGHFRVINVIGCYTGKGGWCRLKQITIAEQVGLTRETVNRKLKDLVAWGYIEKRSNDTIGRAISYRTIMDRGDPPTETEPNDDLQEDASANRYEGLRSSHDSDRTVSDGSHVGYNSKSPITSGVSAADHIRCDHTHAHHNDLSLTTFHNEKNPPTPPADRGGQRGRVKLNEVEKVIQSVANDRPDDLVRVAMVLELIAPLIRQRRLDAPSLEGAVRELADRIAILAPTPSEISKAVATLLDERHTTVRPSDIQRIVKTLVATRPDTPRIAGDVALMRRWPLVIRELEALIGIDRTAQFFSTFTIDKIGEKNAAGRQIAWLVTHLDWLKRHVELNLSAQLRTAISAVFPGVTHVEISTRKATA